MATISRLLGGLSAPQREVFELIVADPEGYDDELVANYLSLPDVTDQRVTPRQVANYREDHL